TRPTTSRRCENPPFGRSKAAGKKHPLWNFWTPGPVTFLKVATAHSQRACVRGLPKKAWWPRVHRARCSRRLARRGVVGSLFEHDFARFFVDGRLSSE